MLISLKTKAKRGWTDYYIQIEDQDQMFRLILMAVRTAGYFEFCSQEEAKLAKALLDQFPMGIREEVIKAIRVFEAISEF